MLFVFLAIAQAGSLFAAAEPIAKSKPAKMPVGKVIDPVAPEWYSRTPSFVIGGGVFNGRATCGYIANHSSQLMNYYQGINAKGGASEGTFTSQQMQKLKTFSAANTECDRASQRLSWLEPTLNITYWGTWLSALAFIPSVILWMAEVPEPGIVSAGLLTLTLLTQIILGPWEDSVFDRIKTAAKLHNRTLKQPTAAPTGSARALGQPIRLFFRFRF